MSGVLSDPWRDVRWYRREVRWDESFEGEVVRPAGSVVIGVKAVAADGTVWGQTALVLPPESAECETLARTLLIAAMNAGPEEECAASPSAPGPSDVGIDGAIPLPPDAWHPAFSDEGWHEQNRRINDLLSGRASA